MVAVQTTVKFTLRFRTDFEPSYCITGYHILNFQIIKFNIYCVFVNNDCQEAAGICASCMHYRERILSAFQSTSWRGRHPLINGSVCSLLPIEVRTCTEECKEAELIKMDNQLNNHVADWWLPLRIIKLSAESPRKKQYYLGRSKGVMMGIQRRLITVRQTWIL
jgi:hypothetical protein